MTSSANPPKAGSSWVGSLVYMVVGWFPNWAGLLVGIYSLSLYGLPARFLGQWAERSPKH